MTILYRFARPSDPSLHRDDLVRTLRVAPLAQSGGGVVAFNDTQKDYKSPDAEPVLGWRLIVVGVNAGLDAASVRVLLEGDWSFLTDAAPVWDDATDTVHCVLLGRTLELDPAGHELRYRPWLRAADATSITDPVFFLERSWRNFADTIYPRGPGPGTGVRYEPLALGGLTAPGAHFLVLAKRTLASGPDDTEVAVVALIASVNTLHVTREIVIARRTYHLAVATWPTRVRCWPVTNLQPALWDVGIQDGAQVAIHTVGPRHSERMAATLRFLPVPARPGWTVDDFALAGGGVDISHMATRRSTLAYSRSLVLLERDVGTGPTSSHRWRTPRSSRRGASVSAGPGATCV
jgi:hypothetical protein